MQHQFFVYILTNRHRTVLYTGVTGNLPRRLAGHRAKTFAGFTTRYNLEKLVFYESASDARSAIAREKQIKGGSRQAKLALITHINPDWRDLFPPVE